MPVIGFLVQSNMKQAYLAMRYVVTMVLACVIAVAAGLTLDELFHTSPLLVLAFLAYAIGSSLYMMIKKLGAAE